MQQQGMNEETAASKGVTVLPTDTLLCVLRVMNEHQVRLLPVVEETGTLLGLISEAHILEAWEEDPLRLVCEVMAECGPPAEDDEPEEGMRLPLMVAYECGEQAYGN
ncbi:MAG: HPP family protein [Hyalangium sp.]|uniref:CBS domain-containing protein n=1 Tax=Hyalangium sp. TaxID=2028555 RepID=UPI00389AAC1E